MSLTTTAQFNPVLSEALNKIGPQEFVGLQILPPRNVTTKSGEYPVFGAEQFDNDWSAERRPGTNAQRQDFAYGQQDYRCIQYMLEGTLPDEDESQANDDGISDVTGALAMKLRRNLMVGHELRVESVIYNADFNSTSATATVGSASARPIKDVQNAVERLHANGHMDNLALIIETSLFNGILNTDDVRKIFNGAAVYTNRQVLLDAMGVSQIILCPTRYNSAGKGKTASRSRVWPTDKYLVGAIGGGDFSNGGLGRTLAYVPDGGIFSAETYRQEDIKSNVLRVFNSVDEVVINTTAGELITSAA
jgi:hypothetical protein